MSRLVVSLLWLLSAPVVRRLCFASAGGVMARG